MKVAKVVVLLVGGWGLSLGLAFVLTIVVAGATSHWGGGRAGNALMMLWAAIALLFLLSALAELLLLKRWVPSLLGRLGLALLYLVPLAGLGFFWSLFTLVLFDR
jgi:hypothetical protein